MESESISLVASQSIITDDACDRMARLVRMYARSQSSSLSWEL